jgi:hypothetical protein
MEGAYRFIRNDQIQPNDIAESGFQATAQNAQNHSLLLALEDNTSLTYQHRSVRDTLGHTNQGNRSRDLLAHSILLFAPDTHQVVGLIEQQVGKSLTKYVGSLRLAPRANERHTGFYCYYCYTATPTALYEIY